MNRTKAVLFAGSLIILGACAHNAGVTSPVALKVTSKNAGRNIVSDVRQATIKAISERVPEARPLTVTADLDVTGQRVTTSPYQFYDTGGTQQHAVVSGNTNPQSEGSLPTVEVHGLPPAPQTLEEVTAVRVSYTISDAGGHVIESNHSRFDLRQDPGIDGKFAPGVEPYNSSAPTQGPYVINRNLVAATADFLAARVKALSH